MKSMELIVLISLLWSTAVICRGIDEDLDAKKYHRRLDAIINKANLLEKTSDPIHNQPLNLARTPRILQNIIKGLSLQNAKVGIRADSEEKQNINQLPATSSRWNAKAGNIFWKHMPEITKEVQNNLETSVVYPVNTRFKDHNTKDLTEQDRKTSLENYWNKGIELKNAISSYFQHSANRFGSIIAAKDLKRGIMHDTPLMKIFPSASLEVKLRHKRDTVFEDATSVWLVLAGLGLLLLLSGIGFFCWWSRSCGVTRDEEGKVPPESVTGARIFMAGNGYENLGFESERNKILDEKTVTSPPT